MHTEVLRILSVSDLFIFSFLSNVWRPAGLRTRFSCASTTHFGVHSSIGNFELLSLTTLYDYVVDCCSRRLFVQNVFLLLCQGVSRGEALHRVAAACVAGSVAWSSAVHEVSAKAPAPVMKLPDGELFLPLGSAGEQATRWF